MNYLKSAFAGFGMSFIGTSLCGSKVGASVYNGYKRKIEHKIYKKLFFLIKKEASSWTSNYDNKEYTILNQKYNLKIQQGNLDFSAFKYDKFHNEKLKADEKNFWFNQSHWSVTNAFLSNNAWCIPTSLLGALFHDKVGRDLTPKINDYFDSDISPYLVTGGIFGAISTLGTGSFFYYTVSKDFSQPWIYSISIIQGFS